MDIGKISKFVLIGLGALGLVAFFMPLIHVKKADAKVSAWQVIKGLDKVSKVAGEASDKLNKLTDQAKATANKEVAERTGVKDLEKAQQTAKATSEGADAAKVLFYIPFVPAAIFVLIGLLAVFRRFSRFSAMGAIFWGVVGIGIWALIRAAAKDVGVEDALGSAIPMLAVSYFGATAVGIVGLFKPEKEEFR